MYRDSFGTSVKYGYQQLPSAIRVIISITVVVFLLQALFGRTAEAGMVKHLSFVPDWSIMLTQPWRFVTYQFLHANFFHVLFNMLWLWWMGKPVEETLGARSFAVLYLISGVGGALINLFFSSFIAGAPTIGASGSVFGVMVAFAVFYPRSPIMLFLLPPIEARYVVAGLIVLDVLFLGSNDNTARIVHLGGALTGYLLIRLHYSGMRLDAATQWWDTVQRTTKKTAAKTRSATTRKNAAMHAVVDAEIIEEVDQAELDRILDKISKTGYEGLTADEKRILFELSKRK